MIKEIGLGTYFWLSFADGSLPKGRQFLGVAIIRAHSMLEAVQVAHALGINPGGEVLGHKLEYDADHSASVAIVEDFADRLLPLHEVEAMATRLLQETARTS